MKESGYLFCQSCNGYYKLKGKESLKDFDSCQCGGELKYVKSIDEIYNFNKICPFCGNITLSIGKFCMECGKPLNTNSKVASTKFTNSLYFDKKIKLVFIL